MKTVLVIFGGVSSEHDVSTVSACSVIKNIPADKYEVIKLGITKDGRWFKFDGDVDLLPDDKWVDEKYCTPALISPDTSCHGLLVMEKSGCKAIHIDVVFPVMHGKNGEDGTVQGLLQLSGIPFVGCDSVSSGVCMDKALTNAMADVAGIAQAKWLAVTDYEFGKRADEFIKEAGEYLGYPIFVKPANAGSSVGVGKAKDAVQLKECIKNALDCDYKVVLEECIDGAEVECAVLGNEEPVASTVGEIVPCNEFYDYQAKYEGDSGLHIPARIGEDKIQQVRSAAIKAYKALGCSGLARVDFFVRHSDGAVLLNEPNTIPGFTSISMYPKLFEASGIPYGELLDRLFCLAIEKWEK